MPQEWRHGWIPLTPGAALQKNHGSKPGPNSKLSKQMDAAIRDKAKSRRSKPTTSNTGGGPGKPSDIEAATAAIRAGKPAQAVNYLTRAMNNAKTPAEKKAIKKQRDELARKLMGR